MLSDLSIDVEIEDPHESYRSYAHCSTSIAAYVFTMLFIVSVLLFGFRNSTEIKEKTEFIPLTVKNTDMQAYIHFNFTKLQEKIDFLNVSFRFVRSFSENESSSFFQVSAFSSFLDLQGKEVKNITYQPNSIDETFKAASSLAKTHSLFYTETKGCSQINIELQYLYTLIETQGIQIIYQYGTKELLNNVKNIRIFILALGLYLILNYCYAYVKSSKNTFINWYLIAMPILIFLITNPFSSFINNPNMNNYLSQLFEALYILLFRYYIISLCAHFSFSKNTTKQLITKIIGIFCIILCISDFLSGISTRKTLFLSEIKRYKALKFIGKINIFLTIVYCLVFFALTLIGLIKSDTIQIVSPFLLTSIFITVFSKVVAVFNITAQYSLILSLVYILTHVSFGAVMILSNDPNISQESKYQQPERAGFEMF